MHTLGMCVCLIVTVLCYQCFLAVIIWCSPLPALSNVGEAAVHTGQAEQQLEHQHHRRHHQTKHEAWRSEPLVVRRVKKLVPAVQVGVKGAEEQGQVAQFGLEERTTS